MNYWDEKKPYYNEFSTHAGCWLSERNITPGHPFQLCQSKETLNPTKRIMVIGDSNAASLIPGLVKHFGKNNIVQRVVDGCLPARKFATNFCKKGITAAFNDINKIHPDVIIIGGFYLLDEHLQQMQFLFDHELKDYRNKTIILGPLPRWGIEGLPAKLMKAYNLYPYKIPEMLTPSPETFTLDKHLAELAKTWGVAYLSPVKTFCSDTKCLVRVGTKRDEIVTWDFAHLTHHASYVLVEKNADLIRKFVG
jgi:SGNH domain-containing protein